jgi:cbb3-type cytochrome oxidase subunit 3
MLRTTWGRALSLVLVAVVLWFFGRSLLEQRSAIGARWDELHPAWGLLALSGFVVLISYAVLIETWRRTVEAWGAQIAWTSAARIWFVSNLGKYVPGKVWQIGAMSLLAEQSGVPAVAAVGSSLVVNLVNLLAVLLIIPIALVVYWAVSPKEKK